MELFLSTEALSEVVFLVVKRWSRRFGRVAPFTGMLVFVAEVGVGFCPGRVFLALEGEAEGALVLPTLMLVWTSGGGGFFIFVATPAGFATTVAMVHGLAGDGGSRTSSCIWT